jgi:hypothetical protein
LLNLLRFLLLLFEQARGDHNAAKKCLHRKKVEASNLSQKLKKARSKGKVTKVGLLCWTACCSTSGKDCAASADLHCIMPLRCAAFSTTSTG